MVKAADRFQYNEGLAFRAMEMNRQSMSDQSAAYSQDLDTEKGEYETATRTMAKVNSAASIVSASLNMAYLREAFRYREICRRFCMPNSPDVDVREVRLKLLKAGVPEGAIDIDRWDISINRAVGGGNKMMEAAIADKMMAIRAAFNPEAQNKILQMAAAAYTGDYSLATDLTPEMPHITDSAHDTQFAFGTFLAGGLVEPKPGLNAIEVAQTMLKLIGAKVKMILQSGGIGTPQDVQGLNGAINYAEAFIKQLAEDKSQKALVKQFNDQLSKELNEVKGFAQRQAQAAKQQQAQGGGLDPKDAAKVRGMELVAQTKAKLASESHAQRTAQRQIQFEQKIEQDAQQHAADLMQKGQEHALDNASKRANLFD